ncbi:MAG: aminotransferase class V-fold PLP-dependent enzyme [Anaerolineales bacterium]|nr:aminotransferase class V-fold PLP-dependent enzyme [Anaerolineales bacterium]
MTTPTNLDFYDRLGLRKLINAHGTLTRLGGSLMAPPVLAAMAAAARHWVDLPELLAKSGDYVAELLGVEGALITSGAAAGLVLATAACVTGDDPALAQGLPHSLGERYQVVIPKSHRNGYDQAVRQVGIELVEFGYIKESWPWQLEAALNEHTAAVVYFLEFAEVGGSLPLEQVIALAHRRGVPVIVDASAEIPPRRNLRAFCDQGADLVIFSGGKDMAGPQSSGLIVGRHELIARCRLNGNPHYSIGRAMKVGKEEIAGLIAALEAYLQVDEAAEMARWEAQAQYMAAALSQAPGVCAERVLLTGPGIRPITVPRTTVSWDAAARKLTPGEAAQQLLTGDPAIAVGQAGTALLLNPQTLAAGEEEVVARRLLEILTQAPR